MLKFVILLKEGFVRDAKAMLVNISNEKINSRKEDPRKQT